MSVTKKAEEIFYSQAQSRLERVRKMPLAEAQTEALLILMDACKDDMGTHRLYEMVSEALADVEKGNVNNEEEKGMTFEEIIPEWLRTGLKLKAWNQLREAGILKEDYRLADGVSKLAAKYIVESLCQDKKKVWKPFEEFWGLKNLKVIKGEFSKEQEDKIFAIFLDL